MHGPYEPQHGHRFNPHKLLLDPYAKALRRRALRWTDAHFGYRVGSAREDLAFDRRDNAARHAEMPRDRPGLHLGRATGRRDTRGTRPSFYEAHVRGFTMLHPDVPSA